MVREKTRDRGKKINENERRKRESFGLHGFFFTFFRSCDFLKKPYTREREKERDKGGGGSELEVVHALLLFLRPFASNN
jgi:hypothetical protein